jgi:hypothetical protein
MSGGGVALLPTAKKCHSAELRIVATLATSGSVTRGPAEIVLEVDLEHAVLAEDHQLTSLGPKKQPAGRVDGSAGGMRWVRT